jgi:hypothetical protein
MTTGQKIALIISGFVALAGGIGFIMFKDYKKTSKPKENDDTKPGDILSEKIEKGSEGEGAKGVQVIINDIASWRGWGGTRRKAPNGVNVKFPIDADGKFGRDSDAAARLIFASYPSANSITRNNARLKWAYSAGYYNKQLPEALKNSPSKAQYQAEFIKGQKASK